MFLPTEGIEESISKNPWIVGTAQGQGQEGKQFKFLIENRKLLHSNICADIYLGMTATEQVIFSLQVCGSFSSLECVITHMSLREVQG